MFFKRFGKLHLHGIVQTKPAQQINKGNLFLSRESNISMISQVCSLDVKEKVKSTNNCFNPPNLNSKWCTIIGHILTLQKIVFLRREQTFIKK